jgi:pantetheine-phosphate adenylyltransferase
MEKIVVFPGSFDPFTIGHESIVRRAFPFFDKIIIAIGYNSNKPGFFPLEKRLEWIRSVFKGEKKVELDSYESLTVEFCRQLNAKYILRGLRTSSDFEYERAIAQTNKMMFADLETIFLLTLPEYTSVNSTIVRDIIRHGGDASIFLPKAVKI